MTVDAHGDSGTVASTAAAIVSWTLAFTCPPRGCQCVVVLGRNVVDFDVTDPDKYILPRSKSSQYHYQLPRNAGYQQTEFRGIIRQYGRLRGQEKRVDYSYFVNHDKSFRYYGLRVVNAAL